MIKKIMTCSGEDSCTIIEVDSIFMGIWEFMGMWDNRGKEQLPQFLSDHPNSCSPNAAQCKVKNILRYWYLKTNDVLNTKSLTRFFNLKAHIF